METLLLKLLEANPATLALIAIVLLASFIAGSLALVLARRNGGRASRIGPLLGLAAVAVDPKDLPHALVQAIDERVVHKWNNTVAPTILEQSRKLVADTMAELRVDVDRLDAAREDTRVQNARIEQRLTGLEMGQVDMSKTLDRIEATVARGRR